MSIHIQVKKKKKKKNVSKSRCHHDPCRVPNHRSGDQYLPNSPVSQLFSLSGEQPEQRTLAYKSQQPTAGCISIFHKYCCYTKHGGIMITLTLWNSLGYVYWYVKIPECGYMEHRFKIYYFYVQKQMALLAVCSGLTLVRDWFLRAPAFVRFAYWPRWLLETFGKRVFRLGSPNSLEPSSRRGIVTVSGLRLAA